mmetsp:Transcript_113784/g.368159  ORF Transcript_113784/g.368159 Transcript_113784/m.368159 type:complete len:312 (+) Transcript_113784:569-1504(+)
MISKTHFKPSPQKVSYRGGKLPLHIAPSPTMLVFFTQIPQAAHCKPSSQTKLPSHVSNSPTMLFNASGSFGLVHTPEAPARIVLLAKRHCKPSLQKVAYCGGKLPLHFSPSPTMLDASLICSLTISTGAICSLTISTGAWVVFSTARCLHLRLGLRLCLALSSALSLSPSSSSFFSSSLSSSLSSQPSSSSSSPSLSPSCSSSPLSSSSSSSASSTLSAFLHTPDAPGIMYSKTQLKPSPHIVAYCGGRLPLHLSPSPTICGSFRSGTDSSSATAAAALALAVEALRSAFGVGARPSLSASNLATASNFAN